MTEEEQIAQAFADDERAIAGEFGAAPPGGDEHEIAAAFGDSDTAAIDATFGKPRNAFDTPEARAWTEQQMTAGGLTPEFRARWEKDPTFWTPEDTDNAVTYGPPLAALAVGNALPAMGAVGTLASGVLLGNRHARRDGGIARRGSADRGSRPVGSRTRRDAIRHPALGPCCRQGSEVRLGASAERRARADRRRRRLDRGEGGQRREPPAAQLRRGHAYRAPRALVARPRCSRGAPAGRAALARVELQPVLEGHNITTQVEAEFFVSIHVRRQARRNDRSARQRQQGRSDRLVRCRSLHARNAGAHFGRATRIPCFSSRVRDLLGNADGWRCWRSRDRSASDWRDPIAARSAEPISTIPLTSSRRIIEDRPITIDDLVGNGRPELQAVGADAPPPGTPTRAYSGRGYLCQGHRWRDPTPAPARTRRPRRPDRVRQQLRAPAAQLVRSPDRRGQRAVRDATACGGRRPIVSCR